VSVTSSQAGVQGEHLGGIRRVQRSHHDHVTIG
jgi:hypothetical protein